MAYPESGGPYFIPNIPLATTDAGVLKEMDIGASSADHGEMLCIKDCTVKRVQFTAVGEAVSGTTTAPTVIFTKRPTPLSATDEEVIATITVPSGTAIGTTVFVDLEEDFAVGDSLEISHTVGVGTPTGIGFWSIQVDPDPEYHGNNTELIESA